MRSDRGSKSLPSLGQKDVDDTQMAVLEFIIKTHLAVSRHSSSGIEWRVTGPTYTAVWHQWTEHGEPKELQI